MSGNSGQGVHSVARDNSTFLSAADDQNISSLLSASAWNGTNISFSFPTSSADYGTQATYGDPAPFNGFSVLTAQQQGEVLRAFSLVSTYTNLTFTKITETTTTHAAIRLANSSSPPTSYAFYPSTAPSGGDVFYGGTGQHPVMGNFDSGQATLHEIGHALGLKHGQDNNTYGVMNANRLDIEFSLMNYQNYIGSTEGFATASTSPQTYMMYDIAALQYMYGANFGQLGHNNVYTWSPTTGAEFINGVSQGVPVDNHIFETIWTAGANSTYDLSNFSQNQVDDMNPGGWMDFSTSQLADLNAFAPSKPLGEIFARGDIYNALEFNGDARSLIDNIITGSGADTIIGNAANNTINAGAGNDTLNGGQGADKLSGGPGSDQFVFDAAALTDAQAATSVFDEVTDYDQGNNGSYSLAEGDQFGLSAVLSAAYNNGSGQSVSSLVQAIEDLSGTFATLQIDPDGTVGGVHWFTIAKVDGLHIGNSVNVILDASLPAGATITVAGAPNLVPHSDFNGDGKSDILWQNDTGEVVIWEQNGTSVIGGGSLGNPGSSWQVKGTGDFNGDARSDILWQNSSGEVAIWEQNGTSVIGGGSLGNPGTSWHAIVTGDFNADGISDVLWQNDNGAVAIWEMAGTTITGGGVLAANPGTSWHAKGAGDFNGDGLSDILWQNDNGAVAIWEMSGTTPIGGGAVAANPGSAWQVVSTGDFNGDGHSDILYQNSNGDVAIWDMNGTAISGGGEVANPGTAWRAVTTGDYNSDGKSDILFQNSNGQAAIWLMSGTTIAGGGLAGPDPGTSWHLQVG